MAIDDAERGLFLPRSSSPSQTKQWLLYTLRSNTRVLITATLGSTIRLSGLLYATDAPRAALDLVWSGLSTPTILKEQPWPTECSPAEFSDGTWQRKSPETYPLEHYLNLYPYN